MTFPEGEGRNPYGSREARRLALLDFMENMGIGEAPDWVYVGLSRNLEGEPHIMTGDAQVDLTPPDESQE